MKLFPMMLLAVGWQLIHLWRAPRTSGRAIRYKSGHAQSHHTSGFSLLSLTRAFKQSCAWMSEPWFAWLNDSPDCRFSQRSAVLKLWWPIYQTKQFAATLRASEPPWWTNSKSLEIKVQNHATYRHHLLLTSYYLHSKESHPTPQPHLAPRD